MQKLIIVSLIFLAGCHPVKYLDKSPEQTSTDYSIKITMVNLEAANKLITKLQTKFIPVYIERHFENNQTLVLLHIDYSSAKGLRQFEKAVSDCHGIQQVAIGSEIP